MIFTGVVCRLQICRSLTAQWFDSTFRAAIFFCSDIAPIALSTSNQLLSTTTRFISVAALTSSAGSVAQQVEERASAAFMPCLSIQVEQIFSVTSLTGYDNLINDQI